MQQLAFLYRVLPPGQAMATPPLPGPYGRKAAAFFCLAPGCAALLSGYKDWSEWQRWGEEEDDSASELADEGDGEDDEAGETHGENPPSEPA